MKSNRGVTLTILIIYIIVLVLVIGILTNISNNFYANKDYIMENGKYISEFNKFNMYFVEDAKNNSNIYSISENEIIFADGTIYTFTPALCIRERIDSKREFITELLIVLIKK